MGAIAGCGNLNIKGRSSEGRQGLGLVGLNCLCRVGREEREGEEEEERRGKERREMESEGIQRELRKSEREVEKM